MANPPKPDPSLLPLFQAGELLTIQRDVRGQNVLMQVEVREPSSIGPNTMRLTANMKLWGVSSYADGRVEMQRRSINRLVTWRERVLEIAAANGYQEILDLLNEEEGEGTSNDGKETDDAPAGEGGALVAPRQYVNPDGSGYQD